MEIAGLAIGVASLAGLYSCCIGAFQLVQKGRSFGKDYKILETKFGNQELRLRAWGRACGLIDESQYDQRLDEPELHERLQATLDCIKLLLSDAKELKERYGLRRCQAGVSDEQNADLAISASSASYESTSLGRRASFGRLFSRSSRSIRTGYTPKHQHESSLKFPKAHWIIEDREKFSELIRHLKDFIDDLEDLTKATQIPRRQLFFVGYEIESIDDVQTLEDMESAREGDHDTVSDAASARLERISLRTASSHNSRRNSWNSWFTTVESSITLESLESYFTARTHVSRADSTADANHRNESDARLHQMAQNKGFAPYDHRAISNKHLRLQATPRNVREHMPKVRPNGKGTTSLKLKSVEKKSYVLLYSVG
jgi:hypothetical protein